MELKNTLKNIHLSKGKPFNLSGGDIWVNLDIFKKFGKFWYYDIFLIRKKINFNSKIYLGHDAGFDNLIPVEGYDKTETYGLFIFKDNINLVWEDGEDMDKDFLLFYR
jgi:hypothetical protein